MVSKEKAIQEIKELVEKYNSYKDNEDFTSNEKQICESLIKPLIKKVLGWDIEDFSEFKVEYPERGKRIDMLICLDGISQFVIEAKSLSKNIIDNRQFYNQAIDYAHSKEKTFAILTNFKNWVVLRCDIKVDFPERASIATLDLTNFTEKEFDEFIWNFNKDEWIKQGDKNQLYSKLDNLKKKRPIDEELLEDMKNWRSTILTNLKKHSRENKIDFKEENIMNVEEEIQRFIDRLIFICYCEDKGLNEPKLKSLKIEKYERFCIKPFLLKKIKELFNEYRENYNSDLFNIGKCDDFFVDDTVIYKILEDLREPTDRIPYNFANIDADILGKVYENFIGHLVKGEKRFKEQKSKGKRKSEGIYYTPQYIVNYIIKHTVRNYIKNKSYDEIKKIKILDPACGSGSFLIKAFDAIIEECIKRLKRELTYEEKEDLLKKCIYGVDKDQRACDITKLNLSLRIAEKDKKIPELHHNIRNGDSLISDRKIVGYLAFDWNQEFKDIINDGMFDIIIGNPPYGGTITQKEKDYLNEKYKDILEGEIETYVLFYYKGIELLRKNGYLGFITADGWFTNLHFSNLRYKIVTEGRIDYILDTYKPFQDAKDTRCHIFIFNKSDGEHSNVMVEMVNPKTCRSNRLNIIKSFVVKWDYFVQWKSSKWEVYLNESERDLIKKVKNNAKNLSEVAGIKYGIRTGDNKKYILTSPSERKGQKLVSGSDIGRYLFNWNPKYLAIQDGISDVYFSEKMNVEKIVVQYVRTNSIDPNSRWLEATIIGKDFLGLNSTTMILQKNGEFPLKYLLGLINSKLMNRYYKLKYTDVNVKPTYLSELPIKTTTKNSVSLILKLVDKLLNLNQKLKQEKNQYHLLNISKEIDTTENQIDEEVYKIYGITEREKKIVENSLL